MLWPLVGRDPELASIDELIADGSNGGVVVAGAAGVGKTRIAAEGGRLAESRGFAVEWVRATRSAASMPLGAFAALLPADSAGGSELLARVRWGLAERAGGRRLLLVVDDSHLLDDASAALVHQLVAAGEAFALITVRLGEPAPDAVRALWKDELCALVELGDLSRPDAEAGLTLFTGPSWRADPPAATGGTAPLVVRRLDEAGAWALGIDGGGALLARPNGGPIDRYPEWHRHALPDPGLVAIAAPDGTGPLARSRVARSVSRRSAARSGGGA